MGSGQGGGSGNPGGRSQSGDAWNSPGNNGTGGLLILYGNSIQNQGVISSNGAEGGGGAIAAGGASGGGSINIFYKESITTGTILANGGARGNSTGYYGYKATFGGAGGNGSISIGNISTGNYIEN